jgi:hypothetical protein
MHRNALVCSLTFVAMLLAIGCGGIGPKPLTNPAPAPSTAAAATKKYTRQEFDAMVIGKTPDEVIAAVGKADSTTTPGPRDLPTTDPMYEAFWNYEGKQFAIIDPISGKEETWATIAFEKGRATNVNHH